MTREKRHTCIICGSKRNEFYMENVFNDSWACSKPKRGWRYVSSVCSDHSDIRLAKELIEKSKELKEIKITYIF
jgi:hypothetical protein